MQPIPLSLLTLAALGILLLVLRQRWHGFGWRTRRAILGAAALAILLFLFGYASHWATASDRWNTAFYWAAIAGYLLLLTVHSLTQPRWLTIASALTLATPILASSILLPLGGLFFPPPRRVQPLGNHIYASWQQFTEFGAASSGTDVQVVYRPPFLPFLEHARLGGRFYNIRCNSSATEIVLQPDHKSVFVRCPSWPGSSHGENGQYLALH